MILYSHKHYLGSILKGMIDMVKMEAIELISNMEDNVSFNDIMYQLYILDKHYKAMNDIENGRLYTSQEIRKSLGKQ